jgi:hypothetical protein
MHLSGPAFGAWEIKRRGEKEEEKAFAATEFLITAPLVRSEEVFRVAAAA